MTTDVPRRRRPAETTRRLVGGVSAAAVLALVAGWSASAERATPVQSTAADVRIVITDPAIDTEAAVAAALAAAARGVERVQLPVAEPAPSSTSQAAVASHSATRAS